jgi:Flp pilus assembly protein TadD
MFNPAADRYLYLPLAGAGFLLAIGLAALPQKGTTPLATTTATLLLLGALGLAAGNRQFIWRDSQSLWEDTAQKNPASRNAWLGLGFDLQRRGLASESTPYFERALEISGPGDAEAWMGLAVALDAHGDSPAARAAMDKALKANPDFRNPEQRAARAVMEIHHARAVRRLLEKHPQKAAE